MPDPIDYYRKVFEFNRAYFASAAPDTPTPPPTAPLPDDQGGLEHEPPPPSLPADDFLARAGAPGVVCVQDFNDAESVRAGIQAGHQSTPVLDFAVKAHGAASLRFDVTSMSSDNAAGAYVQNFSADLLTRFGSGDSFSVQWRQRFNRAMIETIFLEQGGGKQGGIKQAIITTGDVPGKPPANSCEAIGLVLQTYYQRRFPIIYNSCTGSRSHGPYAGLYEPRDGGMEYLLQNATEPFCRYTNSGADATAVMAPGCFGWVADEFMTFEVCVSLGPLLDGEFEGSSVDVFAAREGGKPVHLVSWHPGVGGYFNLSAGALDDLFGKVWLLPYMTNKDPAQVHALCQTWYDELIVSRNPIAFPGGYTITPWAPPVAVDPQPAPAGTWETVAHDFEQRSVVAGTYRYGVPGTFVYLDIPAGSWLVAPETFGITDPAPNVRKSLERWTGSAPVPDEHGGEAPILSGWWQPRSPVPATPSTPPATPPGTPASRPAWLRERKVGEWFALSGTELLSGAIPPQWEGTINAWGGFAWTRTGLVSAANSGHGEYWNPVIGIDLTQDAPRFKLLRASAQEADANYSRRYADGTPPSRHGYDTGQAIEAQHAHDGVARVALCGCYAPYGQNIPGAYPGGPEMEAFNLVTNDWEPAGTLPNLPLWQALPSVCRDPRNGAIYYAAGYSFARYTPQRNEWTMPGGRPGYSDTGLSAWDRSPSCVDTKRDLLVGILTTRGPLRIQRVRLADDKTLDDIAITGMAPINEGAAVTYNADTDRYVTCDMGVVYAIDPDSGQAEHVIDLERPVASVENRFGWMPELNVYLYLPRFESALYACPTR